MDELLQALLYALPVWISAIALTLLFNRIVRFKRCPMSFALARRESMLGLFLILLSIFIGVLLEIAFYPLVLTLSAEYQVPTYSLSHMFVQWFFKGVTFAPFIVALLIRRQNLSTIGLSRHNLRSSMILGILLSGITVLFYVIAFGKENVIVSGLEYFHFYSLMGMLSVGFTEEAMFRGYLQLRLTAWLGARRGWVLTAIIFAICHIGGSIFNMVSVFIIGLVFGWIMQKSENIVGLSIWHAFMDWVWILYRS